MAYSLQYRSECVVVEVAVDVFCSRAEFVVAFFPVRVLWRIQHVHPEIALHVADGRCVWKQHIRSNLHVRKMRIPYLETYKVWNVGIQVYHSLFCQLHDGCGSERLWDRSDSENIVFCQWSLCLKILVTPAVLVDDFSVSHHGNSQTDHVKVIHNFLDALVYSAGIVVLLELGIGASAENWAYCKSCKNHCGLSDGIEYRLFHFVQCYIFLFILFLYFSLFFLQI